MHSRCHPERGPVTCALPAAVEVDGQDGEGGREHETARREERAGTGAEIGTRSAAGCARAGCCHVGGNRDARARRREGRGRRRGAARGRARGRAGRGRRRSRCRGGSDHGHGALQRRVDRAVVRIGAGDRERHGLVPSRRDDPGVEQTLGVGRRGVSDRVTVDPREALADVDRDVLRLVREVLDDDALAHRERGSGEPRPDAEDDRGDAKGRLKAEQTHTIARVPAVAGREVAALAVRAAGIGVQLSAAQGAGCERYAEELVQRNKTVNLTAITELEAVAMKHFLDSFTACAVRVWTGRERVVDVGSGAGFPGLALRIAMPAVKLTCGGGGGKKARFLQETTALLGLGAVEIRNERAETPAPASHRRAAYDAGTAPPAGPLAACAEYLLPFLRIGGDAIVWKGKVDAELAAARKALASVGGEIAAIVSTIQLGVADVLPGRNLVVMRKVRATPDRYPRASAEARRRPW